MSYWKFMTGQDIMDTYPIDIKRGNGFGLAFGSDWWDCTCMNLDPKRSMEVPALIFERNCIKPIIRSHLHDPWCRLFPEKGENVEGGLEYTTTVRGNLILCKITLRDAWSSVYTGKVPYQPMP